MALPKWIEPKITVGNILTILPLIGAIFAAAQGYGAMMEKVDQITVRDIPSLRQVDVELSGQIIAQGKVIDTDRLSTRETLAELKTDVGYIRRYVEEERRGSRP
jgi:hypothetical protein